MTTPVQAGDGPRLPRGIRAALCLGMTLVATAAMGASTPHAGSIDTPSIRRAVTIAEPSVVFILVRISGSLVDNRDGGVHGPLVAVSKGTGWFITPDGAIATATHVVKPSDNDVKVALVDRYVVAVTGRQLATNTAGFAAYMAATIVHDVSFSVRVISQGMTVPAAATDDDLFRLGRPAHVLSSRPVTSSDITVIAVTGHDEPTVLLRGGSPPPIGVPLGIIGYPLMAPQFSVTPTFTYGPLTFIGHGSADIGLPTDSTIGIDADATVLGTDAYAEHGDSGGPVVDETAHVIGMVSFGAVTGQPIFMVSSADIAQVLATAHRPNTLGAADQRWRAGLSAYDGAHLQTALDDFQGCAAASPDNSGCSAWAERVRLQLGSTQSGLPVLLPALGGVALLVALSLVVAVRRRRRTTQGV